MYEYGIPKQDHIAIPKDADPADLFVLTLGILGDHAALQVTQDDQVKIAADEGDSAHIRPALFSARFFDSYFESRLDGTLDPYLLLVGAAAYYLSELPGSAQVLAKRIGNGNLSLDANSLEVLLRWLVRGDWSKPLEEDGKHKLIINQISEGVANYFAVGTERIELLAKAEELRSTVYKSGTPRELLFADIISALIRRRLDNASWNCLPRYSEIDEPLWRPTLIRASFMRELWPAQHRLGQAGVFAGRGAVVQMPTSAGKTRAVEIIIRSAFLSKRTSLAVVVAPFRALSHEISNSLATAFSDDAISINELSDVLQKDFRAQLAELLGQAHAERDQVVVVTPEKLIYILRQSPELAKHIGLIIYDEGHQFDSGVRGITYELLITTLKRMLPTAAQTVLISAVITNADQIGEWLIGEKKAIVSGHDLIPTERSVAFVSWKDARAQLKFVESRNPNQDEFFVPRVLEETVLQKLPKERTQRRFPEKGDGYSVALTLGLKLVPQGAVAIFCGRKDTAAGLSEKIEKAYQRQLSFPKPSECSDPDETNRLHFLHTRHFGEATATTVCAKWGIFFHHGNTPHGIRLAVEHAMKEGLVRFVICTSTLAQGVNLPIRYLIVTNFYQGADRIKVRDFHNLIGRAGRSGMHTEGTILFSDSEIYDKRKVRAENFAWKTVTELLEPGNAEPCASTLLLILEPMKSDDNKYQLQLDPLQFVDAYIADRVNLVTSMKKTAAERADLKFTENGLIAQVQWKSRLLASVESYLMAYLDPVGPDSLEDDAGELAEETLAYFLANDQQKEQLTQIFKRLARHIYDKVQEPERKQKYGKTMYGLQDVLDIEEWVDANKDVLLDCVSSEEILDHLWPLLMQHVKDNVFKKCDTPSALHAVAKGWIQGDPFYRLFEVLTTSGAKKIAGSQRRVFKSEDIVDICENSLGYEGTLLIAAVSELLGYMKIEGANRTIELLNVLQKRLRYGLPDQLAVALHELGFSDRVLASELRDLLQGTQIGREELLAKIKQRINDVRGVLAKYPVYFGLIISTILVE